nr:putative reverse transcriptase domain-containing protein [Tanacetum cinerariifolium]
MTKMIIQIKERLKMERSPQKSYADKRRKPLEFKVRDRVLLKLRMSLAKMLDQSYTVLNHRKCWKGSLPAEVTPGSEPDVSNLKKCLAEPDVQVHMEEIEIDENLRFVEEPIKIVEWDVKKLK